MRPQAKRTCGGDGACLAWRGAGAAEVQRRTMVCVHRVCERCFEAKRRSTSTSREEVDPESLSGLGRARNDMLGLQRPHWTVLLHYWA